MAVFNVILPDRLTFKLIQKVSYAFLTFNSFFRHNSLLISLIGKQHMLTSKPLYNQPK